MRDRLVELRCRLLALLRRRRLERELDDELAFHLEMKEADLSRAGTVDARHTAARGFGNSARLREEMRDMWTFPAIESVWADVRFGFRRLARDRTFTIVAVIALALGTGANSTFFALVNAICLRGLPIDAPERVMVVGTRNDANQPAGLSYAEFVDLRAASTSFDLLAAMTLAPMTISDPDRAPDRVLGAYISAVAFRTLRETPIAGRDFLAEDDRPGAAAVGILSGGVWQRRYGGDRAIVGRTVTVNGRPVTIVGVMTEGFRFPGTADLWLPLATMPEVAMLPGEARTLSVFGRLRDGVARPGAEAELTTMRAQWNRDSPAAGRVRTTVVPINEAYNPSVTQPQWLAFITVGVLVLLIACANVANLLLMRGVSRRREMAVRASIGGTRGRIVRQLVVEGCILAACAAVVGFGLAHASLAVLSTMLPPDALPYWMTFTVDYRVLAVLILTSLVTVLVFGLAPSLHLSKTDPGRVLVEGERGTRNVAARRWMASFLAAECALTLVLLAAVVDGMRTNVAAARTEFRVDGEQVLTAWLTLPRQPYATPDARAAFYDRLEERLAGLGGGAMAALASALPAGGGALREIEIRGRASSGGESAPRALTIGVSGRYFAVTGVPVRGEAVGPADTAVVNERFVQLFLPDRDPLGEYVRPVSAAESPWLRIAGVVPTVRQGGGLEPDPVLYLPVRAMAPPTIAIVSRASGDPAALSGPIREAVAQMDANLPLYRVVTLERAMHEARWNGRVADLLLKSIAFIGAVLALVGLYAVTGHAVGQRRRELAVLAALGARPAQLQKAVLRPTIVQLSAGLAMGAACTYLFDRLFGAADEPIGMTDAATLVPLILAVTIVATAACAIPARRAARIDPIAALRGD
jgi:predicted permease